MTEKAQRIFNESKQMQDILTNWRRHFHQNPEIGLEVPRTASFIKDILDENKIEIVKGTPGHSVLAVIRGANNDRPLGLRADMDALNIPENTELPFASSTPGRMHACGHDGHMAMLLGAVLILKDKPLPQDCYFIFQPGEEDPGGAKPLMESGLLSPLKAIFGIHLDPQQETGKGSVNRSRAMASTDSFEITITGRGGHAALPHQSVDPIAMAAQVINSLQFIVSRLIDPVEPAVLTLGSINGGYRPNVIPDSVSLSGTIRAFAEPVRAQIRKEIEKTLDMYAGRYGGECLFELTEGYPPVINDPEMSDYILTMSESFAAGIQLHEDSAPRMAGEDFSYYLKEIPGAFYWLGCGNEALKCTYPLHHSRFNLDESVLPLGTALHCLTALDW